MRRSQRRAAVSCATTKRASGWEARYAAMASTARAEADSMARCTAACSRPATTASSSGSSSRAASSGAMRFWSAAPHAVSRTLRPTRSNSVTPSSRSSRRMDWVSAGWATLSFFALFVTCWVRATSSKYLSCCSSIAVLPIVVRPDPYP